jgi:hypothetical protein
MHAAHHKHLNPLAKVAGEAFKAGRTLVITDGKTVRTHKGAELAGLELALSYVTVQCDAAAKNNDPRIEEAANVLRDLASAASVILLKKYSGCELEMATKNVHKRIDAAIAWLHRNG